MHHPNRLNHRLETLADDLDFVADQPPNTIEIARLADEARELDEAVRRDRADLIDRSEYLDSFIKTLEDDTEDLMGIISWAVTTLRCGRADSIVDGIDILNQAFKARERERLDIDAWADEADDLEVA